MCSQLISRKKRRESEDPADKTTDVQTTSPSTKGKGRIAVILTVVSIVFTAATIIGIILMREFFSDAEKIHRIIGDHYVLGAFIMISVSAVQVIVAFIPGELVEIASGYIFGTIPGTLLVLVGVTIGSVCAMLLSRKFGIKLVRTFYPNEDINSLPILRNKKERNILTFIIFLIPGTPKDMLTYVIGLTDMKIWQYLLLTTFARIPSIISSAAGGNAVGEAKFASSVFIFSLIAICSIIGVLIYKKIKAKKN